MNTAQEQTRAASRRAPDARSENAQHGTAPILRFVAGSLAFAIVFSLVCALRAFGQLQGTLGLVVAGILIFCFPTARELSKRVLYSGLILLGLAPLTWWLPERIIGIDHGTLLLGIAGGALASYIFSARPAAHRIRELLPTAKWIDAVPFAAAALSALSVGSMITLRAPLAALTFMTSRWDFQSHFDIYYMLRTHGEAIPTIPPPATNTSWGFAEYPQGFHALLATIAELLRPRPTTLESDLVAFMNIQGLLVALTVLIVIAGICALPTIRRHPMILTPAIAIVAAAWIYGPGAIPTYEGFANFYLACGLATGTMLAALNLRNRIPISGVAAVGAGIVGVCNNWVLLISLLPVVLAIALWPVLRHPRGRGRKWWIWTSTVTALTVVGIALPVAQISPLVSHGQQILGNQGGIAQPDFGAALLPIALVIALGFANWAGRRMNPPVATDYAHMALASLGLFVPIAVCLWLAMSQIMQAGAVSYYFHKYLIAVFLFAWPLAVAAAARLLPNQPLSFSKRSSPFAVKTSFCILALVCTQVFGFSVVGLETAGLPPTARPMTEMVMQAARLSSAPTYVPRLLQSALQTQPENTFYVPAPKTIDPILAARWHWGMRAKATSVTADLSAPLSEIAMDYAHAPEVIDRILADHSSLSVIVDPEIYAAVHAKLQSTGRADRLIMLGS